ncbi:unnamed protein product [Sphagnum balticum]
MAAVQTTSYAELAHGSSCGDDDECSASVTVHATEHAGHIGRRRPCRRMDDKVCRVCGDRSIGYNFDAVSCESCKAFFRRNARRPLEDFK